MLRYYRSLCNRDSNDDPRDWVIVAQVVNSTETESGAQMISLGGVL